MGLVLGLHGCIVVETLPLPADGGASAVVANGKMDSSVQKPL